MILYWYKSRKWNKRFNRGFCTLNELRVALGQPPLDSGTFTRPLLLDQIQDSGNTGTFVRPETQLDPEVQYRLGRNTQLIAV